MSGSPSQWGVGTDEFVGRSFRTAVSALRVARLVSHDATMAMRQIDRRVVCRKPWFDGAF
jgi:hypothetical protein